MKFCPNCGAVLALKDATYCTECGKPVTTSAAAPSEDGSAAYTDVFPHGESRSEAHERKMSSTSGSGAGRNSGNMNTSAQTKERNRKTKNRAPSGRPPKKNNGRASPARSSARRRPADENYDGYYDDVRTADKGRTKDRRDPELIKRVLIIAGGTAAAIVLSIFIMFAL